MPPVARREKTIRRGIGSLGGFVTLLGMGPGLAKGRKHPRRSIERPARRGGSERARPAVPSVNVALASSEAQPDVVLDTRCRPRRSRSLDHDAPCCPDCVGAAGHYLCTGDLLPGASAAMMSTGSCWRPSKRHAPNCCSNCGLEMGVCRTSWKRVSCAQRDARAAQGAA